jgi:hypothetical protein
MILTPPTHAASPFHRHRLTAVCKGASHTYRDSILCAILWGAVPGAGAGQMQGATGDQATVIVRKSAWRAEFPPTPGAVFSSDEHGTLNVRHAQPVGNTWHCACVRNMRARP